MHKAVFRTRDHDPAECNLSLGWDVPRVGRQFGSSDDMMMMMMMPSAEQ